MTFFLILMASIIVFDLAALRWGCDSRERMDSAEWERRYAWNKRQVAPTVSRPGLSLRSNGHQPQIDLLISHL